MTRRRGGDALCNRRWLLLQQCRVEFDHIIVIFDVSFVDRRVIETEHAQSIVLSGWKLQAHWMAEHIVEEARLPLLFKPAHTKAVYDPTTKLSDTTDLDETITTIHPWC